MAKTTVPSQYIADNAITTAKIAANAVTAAQIAGGSIVSIDLGANSITITSIAGNAVGSSEIAANAVGNSEIAANAVDSAEIVSGSIDTVHLSADAVDGTKIADDSIDSEHYVDGSIDTAHIGDSQVTNAKLANSSVTVNSNSVALGASITLDTDDIGEGSTNQYFTNARAQSAISAGTGITVSSGEISIAGNAITATMIAANAVGSSEIAGNSVGSTEIAANAVSTSELSSTAAPTFASITTTGNGDIGGNLTVTGNLQVDGTTTTINSTNLSVDDLNITVAAGAANAAAADGAGLTVDGANATITYDGTNDEWDFNKNINVTGTITADGLTVDGGAVVTNATNATLQLQATGGNAYQLRTDINDVFIYNATGARPLAKFAYGGDISFYEDTGTTAKLFWDASEERLGIGTTNPLDKLHVLDGDIGIQNTSGKRYRLIAESDGGFTIRDQNAAQNRIYIDTSGNVGIGNIDPDFRLDVVNNNTSQIHFGSADTKGGWLISTGDNQSIISGGAYWNGTQWIATDTKASNVELVDGKIDFYSRTGLTSGSAFSPIRIAGFNTTGDLYLTAGNSNSGTLGGDAQIHFGYNGTDNYRHSIRTQHDSGTQAGNKIQFYIWDYGTDGTADLGTKSLVEFNAVNGVDAKAGGFVINGTGVIDSNRNLTNIVGLYGDSGTSNIYATDHYFKDTGGNTNFRMNGNVLTIGDDAEHHLAYIGAAASSITGTTTDITQLRGRQIDLYAYDDVAIRAGTGDSFIVHTGSGESFKVNASGVVETVKMQIFNTDEVSSMYISQINTNTLNGMYGMASDTGDLWINYRGYQDGTSYYRDFRFGDGKNNELMHLDGSDADFNFFSANRFGKVRLQTNNSIAGQDYLGQGVCFPLVLRARSTTATNTVAMSFGHEGGDYSNFIGSQKTGSGSSSKAEIVFGGRQVNGQSFTEWGRWHDDGNLEMPYQSSFHASSTSTIVTISAGDTQLMSNQFNKVNGTGQHNIGSDYNTSTGIYTAPQDGKYLFTYAIRWEVADYTWSGYHRTYISVNNVDDYEAAHTITGIGQPVANYYNHTGSVVVYLGAGDTVRLKGGQSGAASKIYAGESGWSGTYLG